MFKAIAKWPDEFSIGSINGTVEFFQLTNEHPVIVNIKLYNIPNGIHGFHVHENPLTSKTSKCSELGGHFNPYKTVHGSFYLNTQRHVGDLINNLNVINNKIEHMYVDPLISLDSSKMNCILNKSLVIHDTFDDEGIPGLMAFNKGTILNEMEKNSLISGNAGNRIACTNIKLCNC